MRRKVQPMSTKKANDGEPTMRVKTVTQTSTSHRTNDWAKKHRRFTIGKEQKRWMRLKEENDLFKNEDIARILLNCWYLQTPETRSDILAQSGPYSTETSQLRSPILASDNHRKQLSPTSEEEQPFLAFMYGVEQPTTGQDDCHSPDDCHTTDESEDSDTETEDINDQDKSSNVEGEKHQAGVAESRLPGDNPGPGQIRSSVCLIGGGAKTSALQGSDLVFPSGSGHSDLPPSSLLAQRHRPVPQQGLPQSFPFQQASQPGALLPVMFQSRTDGQPCVTTVIPSFTPGSVRPSATSGTNQQPATSQSVPWMDPNLPMKSEGSIKTNFAEEDRVETKVKVKQEPISDESSKIAPEDEAMFDLFCSNDGSDSEHAEQLPPFIIRPSNSWESNFAPKTRRTTSSENSYKKNYPVPQNKVGKSSKQVKDRQSERQRKKGRISFREVLKGDIFFEKDDKGKIMAKERCTADEEGEREVELLDSATVLEGAGQDEAGQDEAGQDGQDEEEEASITSSTDVVDTDSDFEVDSLDEDLEALDMKYTPVKKANKKQHKENLKASNSSRCNQDLDVKKVRIKRNRKESNVMEEADSEPKKKQRKKKAEKKEKYPDIVVKLEEHEDKYKTMSWMSIHQKDRGVEEELKTVQGYGCKLCDSAFRTTEKSVLEEHIRDHLQGKLTCDECGQGFSYHSLLCKHRRDKHMEPRYTCEDCGKQYHVLSQFKHHQSRDHNKAVLNCVRKKSCDATFSSVSERSAHYLEAHKDEFVRCDECGKVLYIANNKDALAVHKSTCNCRRTWTICDLCGLEVRQALLARHIARVHHKVKLHRCTMCNYSTSLPTTLRKHMMTHTGERPIKCTICDFSCIREYQLTTHMRTHTGAKPYKCDQCSYASAWNVQLKDHKKAHVSDDRINCDTCHITFKDQRGLNLHNSKEHCDNPRHNRAKPYQTRERSLSTVMNKYR